MPSKSKANNAKSRILRKLGPFECFQAAIYAMELYCGTMITCWYSIPEHLQDPNLHSKLVDTLELAVADTITQHPLLQVGLVNEKTTRPAWARIDHVDLAQHIEWRTVQDAGKYEGIHKEVTLRQLDSRFENLATQPGWRLVVLKLEYSNLLEIMFCWNHANSDGTGGKIFHQTLLQSLNKINEKPDRPSLENHLCKTTVTPKTMMPPQNVIAKYKITPGYAAVSVWKELGPPAFAGNRSACASWGPITITPRETQIRHVDIDNDTLQRVLSVCRTHKTTLTGLLHGIAFVSLAPQLPEDQVATMIAETPLNLRRFMKPSPPAYPWLEPNNVIGNFVSKMDHELDKALVQKVRGLAQGKTTQQERFAALEDEVWSAAVTIRGELQDKLDLGLKNDLVGLMSVVGDWHKYQKDQMKKPRTGSWLVTNVGVIDGAAKTTDGWSIQRSNFSLSASVPSAMFIIGTVAVKGGELCIGVTWQDHIVDVKIGERLSEDLQNWMNHIGSA